MNYSLRRLYGLGRPLLFFLRVQPCCCQFIDGRTRHYNDSSIVLPHIMGQISVSEVPFESGYKEFITGLRGVCEY